MEFLDRQFKFEENGTTVRREILAGLATFLTMAYIIVVNPLILTDAGMDFGAVFTATILAAVTMPFTFSIANGIAIGFTAYVLVKALTGRAKDIHVAVWLLAIVNVLYFVKDF